MSSTGPSSTPNQCGVQVVNSTASSGSIVRSSSPSISRDPGFVLELADGTREMARRVLLATGMEYRFPALPGIVERWGRSVFHCPFCHG